MDKSQYKDIYIFAEQREGIIQSVAYELTSKARELADILGDKVVAVLLGSDITAKAQELIAYGADKVIVMDAPELKDYITEPYKQAMAYISKKYMPDIMLFGATTIGRDLAPRLSAHITTGLTADCTSLEISEDRNLMMTRPAFGGNLMATIVCKEHRPQMSTVRPGVMRKGTPNADAIGEIINESIDFDHSRFTVKLVKKVKEERKGIDITEAKVLISAGRGAGSKGGIAAVNALAETLNAEVSASRALVDAGIISHAKQVGQTGKTVRPDLYFACGISGAIQHLAGMEESDCIIAINKDKFAPIFNVSDLGIVADAQKVLELLSARLKDELKH